VKELAQTTKEENEELQQSELITKRYSSQGLMHGDWHCRKNGVGSFSPLYYVLESQHVTTYRGADKSLARPGRKQATATKL